MFLLASVFFLAVFFGYKVKLVFQTSVKSSKKFINMYCTAKLLLNFQRYLNYNNAVHLCIAHLNYTASTQVSTSTQINLA
jgi:hypothetical protein